ncbi:protein NLRC3-like [Lates japonicus]
MSSVESRHAETLRETGNKTNTAQRGGVISTPQLTDVTVGGNLTQNVSNIYVQSAATTDGADVSPQNEGIMFFTVK